MHEMSIAQSLIDIIREEMERHQARVLNSVRVQIGQLSAVVPEALTFCFGIMISGTQFEGAKLVTEIIPLKAVCRRCSETFEVVDYVFRCPQCGSGDLDTVSGHDLTIVDMEVE